MSQNESQAVVDRATIDALVAHVAVINKAGTIVSVNEAWRAFALANPPVSRNVCEGANYLEVCDAAKGFESEVALAHEIAAGIRSVIDGKLTMFSKEYPCHSPSEQRWFVMRVTRLARTGPPGVVITHENTTERKLAEEAERESQQIIEGIINAIPVRVFWKDRNSIYLGCNKAFAHDAGFADPKDIIGKDDFQIGWVDLAEAYRSDDRQVIESGKSKLFIEEPLTNSEGKTNIILTSKIPLRNSKGEIHGVLGTYMDVTEHKQAEESLKNMQTMLMQSEKMASIGQLTAGIAHEINNPLAFVSSNLNRFQEYFDDAISLIHEWQSFGKRLDESGTYAAELTALRTMEQQVDLPFVTVDFKLLMENTRQGAGRIKTIVEKMRVFAHSSGTEFSESDINEALDETIGLVWNDLKYKVTVIKQYAELPRVFCNIGEVKQVLVNLLMNACHAITDKGEIILRTFVENNGVAIQVQDTGGGIKQEHIGKVFDPFFTTKPVGTGTGLGLWISATIIHNHNGTLTVKSKENHGTTFTITLPVHHVEEQAKQK